MSNVTQTFGTIADAADRLVLYVFVVKQLNSCSMRFIDCQLILLLDLKYMFISKYLN